MSGQVLCCGQCDGVVAVAKVNGTPRLACHCTHVDGSIEGPEIDVTPPEEWVWR
jgi:hypothetical protein